MAQTCDLVFYTLYCSEVEEIVFEDELLLSEAVQYIDNLRTCQGAIEILEFWEDGTLTARVFPEQGERILMMHFPCECLPTLARRWDTSIV